MEMAFTKLIPKLIVLFVVMKALQIRKPDKLDTTYAQIAIDKLKLVRKKSLQYS